jgi:hypothetical protein
VTPAERLDQLDLAGQMVRIARADAMQFIQQFLGDQLRRGMLHALDDAVSYGPDRGEATLLFEPVNQKIRRRFVIRKRQARVVPRSAGQATERQIGPAQADSVNGPKKPSPKRFNSLVQSKPDA